MITRTIWVPALRCAPDGMTRRLYDSEHAPISTRMLRALTSMLWLIAALALGFEAVAQPCDLRAEMMSAPAHEAMADMPCHDGMMMAAEPRAPAHDIPDPQMPDDDAPACCCAALLGNGVTTDAPHLGQPVPGLTLWATPLPDTANSILLEYEPPPPRA